MVFGKLLSDLAFGDIERLQKNDVRESVVLEYKSQFKSGNSGRDDVLKEVSALANTFGGYLIFGVKEKGGQGGGQIESIPGVDPIPNLKQTLAYWGVEWVYPPLTEIEVSDAIPVGKGDRACYVVHVPASVSAPHFLLERRGCFVRLRVDEHSMTFEPLLAKQDEIWRLTDRRKALVDHRNEIIRTAIERWKALGTPRLTNSKQPAPAILFYAVPQFPAERVIEPGDLHALLERAAVAHSRCPWHAYPWAAQQDAILVRGSEGRDPSHLELTSWGSVFIAEHLSHETGARTELVCSADVQRQHLIAYPALWLLFLRNLLGGVGLQAQVLIHVELRHVKGIPIQGLEPTWGLSQKTEKTEYARSLADETVWWEGTLSAAQLQSNPSRYAVAVYRRLAFGVGCRNAYENPRDEEIINWGCGWLGLDKQDLLPT